MVHIVGVGLAVADGTIDGFIEANGELVASKVGLETGLKDGCTVENNEVGGVVG